MQAIIPRLYVCTADFVASYNERLLLGDHFYVYECARCADDSQEHFERLPMSWCSIIHLVLYHLCASTDGAGHVSGEPSLMVEASGEGAKQKKCGTSVETLLEHRKAGFYRWREDICRVIDERWPYLSPGRTRTAAWQNSVSSILSANPDLFASGQLVVKQSGWWTLAAHSPPIPDGMSIDISDEILHPRSTGTDSTQMSISEPQQRKSELLQRLQSIDPEILKAALAQSKRSVASIQKRMKIDSAATAVATSTAMEEAPVVTKKEAPAKREAAKKESPAKKETPLKKAKRPSEEDEQLRLIESMPLPDDPAERVRRARLRRKLLHHKAQRAAGESIVDLKARLQQLGKPGAPFLFIGTHELDEYGIPLRDDPDDDCDPAKLLEADIPFLRNPMLSIKARLLGASAIYNPYPPLRLWDPYGARHISLYIHRDERTCPPRLAVLRRICGETHPIDCCLLRPEWIGALNRFLSSLFWPGIDVSESLEYPELCILAMHRQLIVGAAVMNPEGYIAYIGVHPEWRNQGLSRRMLAYLLNRSSIRLNVDATVHVSVDNPAMLLYQQMGFKLEYYVYNHYDTFYDSSDATRVRAVSEDSQAPRDGVYWRERHSKHAFLLRFFRDGYRRAALCKSR